VTTTRAECAPIANCRCRYCYSQVEAYSLDDLDVDAAKAGVAEYKAKFDAAAADSLEAADAQIGLEVYTEMCNCLGVTAN
jgi:hypothetical protein